MYPFGKGAARIMPYLLLSIPVLLYLLLGFGPSMVTVLFSFTDATGVPGQTWNFIGFENYTTFFTSSDSGDRIASIGRSLYFAVAVVVIQNAVGLFMAILINKKLKGDVLYRSVFFLPVVLGVTVSGLIWQLLANPLGGPAQALLNFLEPAPTSLGIMILHLNWSFLCKFGCTWVTR